MRTSWQKPANRGLLFKCVGGRLLEPILTQTAHFLVPLQRLKSLNHHPQWRVGNFGENYHAETIHYTRCGQKPCALTTRRSRSVRSRRLVAGRCNEQLGKKRAAHRIRVGGHCARCNLGLLRNALAGWSALITQREQTEPDGTRLHARCVDHCIVLNWSDFAFAIGPFWSFLLAIIPFELGRTARSAALRPARPRMYRSRRSRSLAADARTMCQLAPRPSGA
jgi:hypothetical protein